MNDHQDALGEIGILVTGLIQQAVEASCQTALNMLVFALGIRYQVALVWSKER